MTQRHLIRDPSNLIANESTNPWIDALTTLYINQRYLIYFVSIYLFGADCCFCQCSLGPKFRFDVCLEINQFLAFSKKCHFLHSKGTLSIFSVLKIVWAPDIGVLNLRLLIQSMRTLLIWPDFVLICCSMLIWYLYLPIYRLFLPSRPVRFWSALSYHPSLNMLYDGELHICDVPVQPFVAEFVFPVFGVLEF